MMKPVPIAIRLERLSIPVPEAGCWIWIGELCDLGYGVMRVKGKVCKAHRVSYEFHSGMLIPEGMKILHRCDVRCCINPDHLFVGTQLDNIRDMDAKGRRKSLLGTDNGRAKLTEQQVLEIRASPLGCEATGKIYGVSRSAVNAIKIRRIWKHL